MAKQPDDKTDAKTEDHTDEKPSRPGAVRSAADAARRVTIEEPELDEDGEPTGKTRNRTLREREVLAFRDHGTHLNVVTRDGRKYRVEQGA